MTAVDLAIASFCGLMPRKTNELNEKHLKELSWKDPLKHLFQKIGMRNHWPNIFGTGFFWDSESVPMKL